MMWKYSIKIIAFTKLKNATFWISLKHTCNTNKHNRLWVRLPNTDEARLHHNPRLNTCLIMFNVSIL